jgi:hypothetical protein
MKRRDDLSSSRPHQLGLYAVCSLSNNDLDQSFKTGTGVGDDHGPPAQTDVRSIATKLHNVYSGSSDR